MSLQKTTLKAVIFDLDGTLIDTEPLAAQAVADCFKSWNIPLDSQKAQWVTGRTWENAFKVIFQDVDLPMSKDDAARKIIEVYREKLQSQAIEVPGAVEAVRTLKAEGVRLALVSGSHRREIFTALDLLGIRDLFELILGAEDYPRSKPAPDGYLKAIDTLGLDPLSTLIFEDSTPGIASARAAGVYVIAIRATNHFSQDQSEANDHIDDLRAVSRDWIQEAMGKPARYALDSASVDPVRLKREREKSREYKKSPAWKAILQKGICHYCEKKFKPADLTLDHLIPLARGGTSAKSNCVPACKKCNTEKKLDTPVDQILKRGLT